MKRNLNSLLDKMYNSALTTSQLGSIKGGADSNAYSDAQDADEAAPAGTWKCADTYVGINGDTVVSGDGCNEGMVSTNWTGYPCK